MLFIKGLYKTVSKDQLKQSCEKYGEVQTLNIKTVVMNGEVKSRGMAIVQYAKKEQATEALKSLPFQTELGDLLEIDYYMSKESRM